MGKNATLDKVKLDKVNRYVFDFEQKKKLLEVIPEADLRHFLQGRGLFFFGSKDQLIEHSIPIFFGLEDMQELFHLAGWDTEG